MCNTFRVSSLFRNTSKRSLARGMRCGYLAGVLFIPQVATDEEPLTRTLAESFFSYKGNYISGGSTAFLCFYGEKMLLVVQCSRSCTVFVCFFSHMKRYVFFFSNY